MTLIRILKSRFQKETQEDWILARRDICKSCEYNSLNSPHRSFKNILFKLLSDFYTWITRSENEDLGECACSCPIYYKTRDKDEVCYSKEIGKEDKWKSIYVSNKK